MGVMGCGCGGVGGRSLRAGRSEDEDPLNMLPPTPQSIQLFNIAIRHSHRSCGCGVAALSPLCWCYGDLLNILAPSFSFISSVLVCYHLSLSLSSAHSYTTHQKAKREILCKILVFFMTLGLQRIRIRKGLRGNEELQLQKKNEILKYLLFMLEVMLLYLNFFLPR